MLDMEELAIRDRQQDRADQAKIRSAQAILADPRKAASMMRRAMRWR
jgi:hypothetical protein